MLRVLLISKNKPLADYCRRNLPDGFRLKLSARLNLRGEATQGIVLFDSLMLAESSDAMIAAAAEHFGAAHGAVTLGVLMHEDNRAQAFSLFPENLRHVHTILHYRTVSGKVQGFSAAEFRWFLETQQRIMRQTGERVLTQSENRMLAGRLARLEGEVSGHNRYPAFMHGRSQAIARFRQQVLSTASEQPFTFITGRDEPPLEDFLEYFGALLRPDKPVQYRIIDLEKTPPTLHAQAIWPARKKARGAGQAAQLTCLRNLHHLGWANQATLLAELRTLREQHTAGESTPKRYIFAAPAEIAQQVRRGTFRQELYSLLRKGVAELPPLFERPEDITHIAAEYISRRNYSPLQEDRAALAARILEKFDISSGYRGLFMTLDLLHDLQKSKGLPVFELLGNVEKSEAFTAARSFLREQVEPSAETLFQNLAGGERDALSLDYVERHYIAAVCERYAWQVTEAARHLGISRKTLYDKMRRYKLARPENPRRAARRAS